MTDLAAAVVVTLLLAAMAGIALLDHRARTTCTAAPRGWYCTRHRTHDGPCAAWPTLWTRLTRPNLRGQRPPRRLYLGATRPPPPPGRGSTSRIDGRS